MTDQNQSTQPLTTTGSENNPQEEVTQTPVSEAEIEETAPVSEEEPEAEIVSPEEADAATAKKDAEQESASEPAGQPQTPQTEKKDTTDWKDAYVRLAADFDNHRKRTSKEFDDVRKREREKVISAWLDVYDNTERALAALPEKEGPWFEGFVSILKQMDACLASFGIKVVDDTGAMFDAKRHEAMSVVPNPNMQNNQIMYVDRKGFVYENGDVMRVARVVVVRNPS